MEECDYDQVSTMLPTTNRSYSNCDVAAAVFVVEVNIVAFVAVAALEMMTSEYRQLVIEGSQVSPCNEEVESVRMSLH